MHLICHHLVRICMSAYRTGPPQVNINIFGGIISHVILREHSVAILSPHNLARCWKMTTVGVVDDHQPPVDQVNATRISREFHCLANRIVATFHKVCC